MPLFQFVKITRHCDGTYVDNPVWCLGVHFCGDSVTACNHTEYGAYQGRCHSVKGFIPTEYEVKEGKSGITCEDCKNVVRYFKSVKI